MRNPPFKNFSAFSVWLCIALALSAGTVLSGVRQSSNPEMLQKRCAELSQTEGKTYEYMEGNLKQANFYATDSIADCMNVPNCEEARRSQQRAAYVAAFSVGGHIQKVTIRGTVAELEQLPKLINEKKYTFCVSYDPIVYEMDHRKSLIIDRLETLKMEE